MPLLREALKDKRLASGATQALAAAMTRLEPSASSVGAVLECLRDANRPELRRAAAAALGRFAVVADRVVGPLVAARKDREAGVRDAADTALEELADTVTPGEVGLLLAAIKGADGATGEELRRMLFAIAVDHGAEAAHLDEIVGGAVAAATAQSDEQRGRDAVAAAAAALAHNRAVRTPVAEDVAGSPPGPVLHAAPAGCMLERHFPRIDVRVERPDRLSRLRVYFKGGPTGSYYYVDMHRAGETFAARLPRPTLKASPVSYYVQGWPDGAAPIVTPEVFAVVVTRVEDCPAGLRIVRVGAPGEVTVYGATSGAPIRPTR